MVSQHRETWGSDWTLGGKPFVGNLRIEKDDGIMATNNYSISFKSFRVGTSYTLYIGGGSGEAIPLKGAAQPFVTQESDEEDMFMPVRTQSGYIRIVDDGNDDNGDALGADWWKDLLPTNSTERPVRLIANGVTVVWQGYIQSQNFSGTLYGNPQEREFPVQCGVATLDGLSIATDVTEMKNFAYLIASMISAAEASGVVEYTSYSFQGGADAKSWLLNRVDYQNFMHTVDGSVVPRYNTFDILTDICKFWGWTCRTRGQQVIFSCMDDGDEQNWVTFSKAKMLSLTAGTAADASGSTATVTLEGNIFANTNNDETMIRGIKRAVVKVDVNPEDTLIKFAPKDLESEMGEPTVWVSGGEDLVGYFKSPNTRTTLDGRTMSALVYGSTGGFERRIIFTSAEAEDGIHADMMLIQRDYVQGSPIITMQTKQAMAFGGGSLKIKATLYEGANATEATDILSGVWVRLGIGMTRNSAQWFYLYSDDNYASAPIHSGWSGTVREFLLSVTGGNLNGVKVTQLYALVYRAWSYPSIPVADGLYGYLFFDILGGREVDQPFEIANLEIDFTRNKTTLPSAATEVRERTITAELTKTKEYTADNSNTVEEKWNADCIFATDNGLEYGHGLIMSPLGSWVVTVPYGSSQEHPEQHLANRVASFGRKARRMLTMELRSDATNVGFVTAEKKVSFGGTLYYALAIGGDWRDDIVKLTLIEL